MSTCTPSLCQFCIANLGERLLEHMSTECLPSHFGGENEGIHMGCMLASNPAESAE